MKLLVRFLLFFSFLVLGADGVLFANTEPYTAALMVRPGQSGTQLPAYRLKATQVVEDENEDEKEDKQGSARKHDGADNYFTTFLFIYTGGYLDTSLDSCLPPGMQSFCTALPKYIMYGVFRV